LEEKLIVLVVYNKKEKKRRLTHDPSVLEFEDLGEPLPRIGIENHFSNHLETKHHHHSTFFKSIIHKSSQQWHHQQ